MLIDVESVSDVPKRIDLEIDREEIDLEGEPVRLLSDVTLAGEVKRVGGRIELEGTVEATVSLDCTRCLEDVRRSLAIPFRDLFVESLGTEPEKSVADDQLDESRISDGNIDLKEVIREQILLAVPEQIFCREDCKGLCSKCGENLNLINCKCADDETDPRWAALKNIV